MRSDSINEIAAALSKAQSQMIPAKKDATNPHLKNKYATLDSIIDSVRKPLSENGLCFTQIIEQGDAGIILETWLLHSSGQWIQGEVKVEANTGNRGINEVQALGSALTYYKRYALSAMLGISVADEDDDGNSVEPATGKQPAPQSPPQAKKAKSYKFPSTAAENFYNEVQEATCGYYDSPKHLTNTIGGWFNFGDKDLCDSKLSEATDHAKGKQDKPLFDE